MREVIFPTILLLLTFTSHAQLFDVGKTSVAEEVIKRTLLVRVYEIGDEDLKPHENDQELVNAYNDALNRLFTDHWKLNSKIEFATKEEINNKCETTPEKYAVVDRGWWKNTMRTGSYVRHFSNYHLFLRYPKSKKKNEYAFIISYPDDGLDDIDYRFFIYQCHKHVNAVLQGVKLKDRSIWNPEENLAALASTTLYLPEGSFEGNLKVANSKFCGEIVLQDPIETYKSVRKADNNTSFMSTIWSHKKNFYQYVIIDAATMDMIGLIGMGGVKFSLTMPTGPKQQTGPNKYVQKAIEIPFRNRIGLRDRHFDVACKMAGQKLNY